MGGLADKDDSQKYRVVTGIAFSGLIATRSGLSQCNRDLPFAVVQLKSLPSGRGLPVSSTAQLKRHRLPSGLV